MAPVEMMDAASGAQGHAPETSNGSRQTVEPPWETRVTYVYKLLKLRGESAAKEIRQRLDRGESVVAKGLKFDVEVLQEALRKWQEHETNKIKAKTVPIARKDDDDDVHQGTGLLPKTSPADVPRASCSDAVGHPVDEVTPTKVCREGPRTPQEGLKRRCVMSETAESSVREKHSAHVTEESAPKPRKSGAFGTLPCSQVFVAGHGSSRVHQIPQVADSIPHEHAPGSTCLNVDTVLGSAAHVTKRAAALHESQQGEPSRAKDTLRHEEEPTASCSHLKRKSRMLPPSMPEQTREPTNGTTHEPAPMRSKPKLVSAAELMRTNGTTHEPASMRSKPKPESAAELMPAAKRLKRLAAQSDLKEATRIRTAAASNAHIQTQPSSRLHAPQHHDNTRRTSNQYFDNSQSKDQCRNGDASSSGQDESSELRAGTHRVAPPHKETSQNPNLSVKELKASLSDNGIDFSGCVEKADLEALWVRLQDLRSTPLKELQTRCCDQGGPPDGNIKECSAFLMRVSSTAKPADQAFKGAGGGSSSNFQQGQPQMPPSGSMSSLRANVSPSAEVHARGSAAGGAAGTATGSAAGSVAGSAESLSREQEALREAGRILSLRRERFYSSAAWGFAVLGGTTNEVAAVQRAYRALMKKMHPDKAGHSQEVARAVEVAREAKDACERSLSRLQAPGAPRYLEYAAVCLTKGQRRFKLHWSPPVARQDAPVRKYIVSVFDPAYGRALTVTVLEPDYSEELRRFVPVEELTSYIFAEEELLKMKDLWQQPFASVQVAAVNEAGQGPFAKVEVSLLPPRTPATPQVSVRPQYTSTSGVGGQFRTDDDLGAEDYIFNSDLHMHIGKGLRKWLNKQKRFDLASWLKHAQLDCDGMKDELVERIVAAMEGDSCPSQFF